MPEAAKIIQQFMAGKTKADFLSDLLLQHAVIHDLEAMGEAAKNLLRVLPDATTRFPAIPFSAIYAQRNHLSHGYFMIDISRVWQTVENDIPLLRTELELAVASWNAQPHP